MENFVASDLIGWIDMSRQPLNMLATTNVLVWKFFMDVESDEEIPLKSIEVHIKPKIHCQIHMAESLICAIMEPLDYILDMVSNIH